MWEGVGGSAGAGQGPKQPPPPPPPGILKQPSGWAPAVGGQPLAQREVDAAQTFGVYSPDQRCTPPDSPSPAFRWSKFWRSPDFPIAADDRPIPQVPTATLPQPSWHSHPVPLSGTGLFLFSFGTRHATNVWQGNWCSVAGGPIPKATQ